MYKLEPSIITGVCSICGKVVMTRPGQVPIHADCAICPKCKSDFAIWKTYNTHTVVRCLNCLSLRTINKNQDGKTS